MNASILFALALAAALPQAATAQQAGTPPPNRFAATIAPAERFEIQGMLVERHGGKGRPLILIPGLASGAWVWQDLVRRFSPEYTLYVVTLPGFDGRPAPAAAPFAAARSAVGELVAGRRLDKPVLVGHSLGGAAVLAAAAAVPETRAVATIAAPSDPHHILGLFDEHLDTISEHGEARVKLAGREFTIRRQFIDDVAEHRLLEKVHALGLPLLVLHSPLDRTVALSNAMQIFEAARHPKSFVSLDSADHLLSRREDAQYVAGVIAAWSTRYLDSQHHAV